MNKIQKNGMNEKPDLKKYYTLGLPLLGLMALIAVVGVAGTFVLWYFLRT